MMYHSYLFTTSYLLLKCQVILNFFVCIINPLITELYYKEMAIYNVPYKYILQNTNIHAE